MTDKQLGLILIAPMIVATAVVLMRKGALGPAVVALIAAATTIVAVFLFTTL